MRRTQAERREQTRAALLKAARELWVERGWANTGREDIAERAGVTRGALYHHFESMSAVGIAVIEALNDELAERVIAAALTTTDPREQLRRSTRAYIDACADPSTARLLNELPLVYHADRLRELSDEVSAQLMEPFLERIGVDGDRRIIARIMLGMLEDGSFIAAANPRSKRKVIETLDAMFTKLIG